jgi:hypothetical protein
MLRTIVMIRLAVAGVGLVALAAGRLVLGGGWEAPYSEPLRLSPGPSATAPPAALTAFTELVSDGGARAQARIDGVMRFAVPAFGVNATIKLAGARATVQYDTGSSRSVVITASGTTVKTRAKSGGATEVLPTGTRNGNPFGKPMAVEIQYQGLTTIGGKKLHHLVIVNPRSLAAALGPGDHFGQLDPDFSAFDVYVNDKGVPSSARIRFQGSAAYAGVTVDLDVDYRYTFTKVS